jgi:hypothetical protein
MVVSAQCEHCGTDLRHAPIISALDDPFGLSVQHIIQHWFGIVDTPPDSLFGMIEQSGHILYHILCAVVSDTPLHFAEENQEKDSDANLERIISFLQSPRQRREALNKHRSQELISNPISRDQLEILPIFAQTIGDYTYLRYRSAFRALTNWPHGLFQWLDDNIHPQKRAARHSIPWGAPANLYGRLSKDKWQHPAFQFLQDAFDVYLQERLAPTHLQRLRRFSSTRTEVI